MDGGHNKTKNEAVNKSPESQQHNPNQRQSQQNSPQALSDFQVQPPTNRQQLRGSVSMSNDSTADVLYSPAVTSTNELSSVETSSSSSRDRREFNFENRHSLSSSLTANGAPSTTSFLNTVVVKASSTGTLSTPSSRSYAQHQTANNSLLSDNNVNDVSCVSNSNAEFKTSFASLPQPGSFFNSSGLTLSSIAANDDGESTSLPRSSQPFKGQLTFPKHSVSALPPQNRDQAVHNWQDSQVCVKDRLIYLHKTGVMSDIQFKVGKPPGQQLVNAHKFVLSVGSAVFDALFNGRLATSDTVIDIPDVEPAAFNALLKFLYTDEVLIGPETVMTTLYAAKKYAVPALERECVEFLKHNLSPDNAFMLLTQARLFDEPQLAALCLETIDKNTAEALFADGFTDIDLDTLCAVLERDTLGIRECRLFTAVCRWAEAECIRNNLSTTCVNKRQVLSKALRLIRFPLMTVEEFAMGSAQSGILEDREVVELFLFFTVNPKPSTSFVDVPRCCLTGKEQVVSRFCQIECRWGYSGTSDRIRFLVNQRIFVVGFGLYGSIHGPTEYSVNIQIIHMDSTKVLGSNDPTFQCDGSTSTFRVMFKEPIEILPNTSYIACATLKGPDSYYGSKGLRKVTHESAASGKVTFQFTYAAGNNNGTSVEDGQIPEIVFYT